MVGGSVVVVAVVIMCGFSLFFRQVKHHVYKRSEYEPIIEDAKNEGILFIITTHTHKTLFYFLFTNNNFITEKALRKQIACVV